MPDVKLKVTTKKEYECVLSKDQILEYLMGRSKWMYPLRANNVTVSITVTCPSGGDCSGETFSIDDVGGLKVTWTEIEVK